MEKTYKFDVKVLEAGQRRAYADSYYTYIVTSDRSEDIVKKFCMNVLKKSYSKKNMSTLFDPELREFERITNNNEGRAIGEKRRPETYRYQVRELYTD